ncbi:DUF7601 domain-containing protein [Anaerolactibacter massiliensis]|uniref:DUF7601 domain-containing protein n=1 Tax=Anaerolactibacter massiliensis TaxID=2044573 RepID=UPI000CF9365B|nr:hypothetical protein [Anaerolactibacter massiliensis]
MENIDIADACRQHEWQFQCIGISRRNGCTDRGSGNATVTVWLKHGESIVFKDLYESCTYNITEDPENYTASSKITTN